VSAAFDPGNRLIAALDVPTAREATELARALRGAAGWVKVGLELYTSAGPDVVRALVDGGARVMLDLKLHDIPATVGRATAQVASLGAELLTVHTGGGAAMLRAAAEATGPSMRILGVTVLTSMDAADLDAVGAVGPVEALVEKRARLAVTAGCGGVVASPREAARLRAIVPGEFLIVTPGVRPAGADAGDQKRIMTPAEARAAGADLIVVGRPIRDAGDPAAAARAIAAELDG
jgi:orotidine-5'-phosphate decarboxylase